MPTPAGFSWTPDGLTCDGVSVADISSTAGTPLYLYSGARIRLRVAELQQAFAGSRFAIHYALKANSTLAIVRLIHQAGGGADANSGGEIDVALRAGIPPHEIVFTGVGKTRAELERAVGLGIKAINVESAGELDRLDEIATALGRQASVALRVNPDIDPETHAHISTGLKRNKFGIPLELAPDIYRAYAARTGLRLTGVHAHIGSQIRNIDPLRRAAAALASLARHLRDAGIPIRHLDIGGGLGVSYEGSEEPDVQAYGAAMIEATRDAGTELLLEPGRWLTATAGILVATVVDVKPAPDDRRFVVLDAGMTELIRPALYGAFHRIAMVAPRAGALDVLCDVVGPVCESSDTFGRDRPLPDPRVGDLVAVFDAGAYGSVMASNYNRRPQPAEAMVDDGRWQLIRRRQTIEEILAWET